MAQYSYGLIIIYTKQENIVYGVNTLFIDNVVPGDIFMVDYDNETPYVIKEYV